MVTVLTVSPEFLANPLSWRVLRRMAREHELVLICAQETALPLVRCLRDVLPRHQVVVLLVDGWLRPNESAMLDEALNTGQIPIVCTTGDVNAFELEGTGRAVAAGASRHGLSAVHRPVGPHLNHRWPGMRRRGGPGSTGAATA